MLVKPENKIYHQCMKRIISLCALVLFVVGLSTCASSPERDSQPRSSVWMISRDGNTLFLGGSVHVLRETDYPLTEEFDRAFSLSTLLVLEADIEQLENESIMQYLMMQMRLPGNQTLRSTLDPDVYELLKAKYDEYGLQIDGVARLKPSMAVSILDVIQIQQLGFVQQGVDMHYLEKAKSEGKALDYLETVEAQIRLIVTMGDGYENDFVLYSLQELESTETGIDELVAEWKEGGSAVVEASLMEMRERWPELYRTMVADRNAAWLPQIEGFLSSGQVSFVLVGLAHLHGPDGLLRQLERLGYTVGPLQ